MGRPNHPRPSPGTRNASRMSCQELRGMNRWYRLLSTNTRWGPIHTLRRTNQDRTHRKNHLHLHQDIPGGFVLNCPTDTGNHPTLHWQYCRQIHLHQHQTIGRDCPGMHHLLYPMNCRHNRHRPNRPIGSGCWGRRHSRCTSAGRTGSPALDPVGSTSGGCQRHRTHRIPPPVRCTRLRQRPRRDALPS